ncbi:MAG: NDP-sugar synthase [Actinomycetota bacterium]|nr:NDP-sugar synthase [Actinomycetota bacterium]
MAHHPARWVADGGGYHRGMEVRAVLFAAGRGKRLRPLTDRLPKPALPVLDLPLCAWSLAALVGDGPGVVVNASHLGDRLASALSGLPFENWELLQEGPEAYGTAGTLRALRERVTEHVITWNGDIVTDLDPAELLDTHSRVGAAATIAITRVAEGADVVGDSRVTGFIDRRCLPSEPGGRFIGAGVFERRALELLPDHRPAGLGETLLRDLAEPGDLGVHDFTGYWLDVGTPERYLELSLDVLYGRAPALPIPPPGRIVEINGGRAYVGPDSVVAEGTLRAGAVVCAGAAVMEGATVENAVVWPGARVPAGTRVNGTIWTG